MTSTASSTVDDRPDRGTPRLARRQLGPRPLRRRVVGSARPRGMGGAVAPGRLLRPRPQPQRRDAGRANDRRVRRARAPMGMGIGLVSPTIATHGTREQIERYIPDAVTGRLSWCQLFSEPGAGSDLAGLSTRAVRDGDVWVVNGQKVWTSGGHFADLGMLLARTDPTVPKHQGISWFAFDMHQPGVEVRPLREMTGNTMFSEVFFTDAVVRDDACIGEVNNGWTVANTTLFHERSGMGARVAARSSSVHERARWPATSTSEQVTSCADRARRRAVRPAKRGTSPAAMYIALAREFGKDTDPVVRQRLAQAHILGEVTRLNSERHKAIRGHGRRHPRLRQLLEAPDGPHPPAQPRPRRGDPRPAAMLHAYYADGRAHSPMRRAGRRRTDHRAGSRRAGTPDLRRHRSDPAQHRRERALGLRRNRATSHACRSTSCPRTADHYHSTPVHTQNSLSSGSAMRTHCTEPTFWMPSSNTFHAEATQTFDLRFDVVDDEVEVHPVLSGLRLGHTLEHESRRGPFLRNEDGEGRVDEVLAVAERSRQNSTSRAGSAQSRTRSMLALMDPPRISLFVRRRRR